MLTIKENLKEIIEDGQTYLSEIKKALENGEGDTDAVTKDIVILSCIDSLVDKMR